MAITLELAPEIEARLIAEAAAQGVSNPVLKGLSLQEKSNKLY